MNDDKKKGLGSASEETKKRVSKEGHEAQGDDTSNMENGGGDWEEASYMEISGMNLDEDETEDDSSGGRGSNLTEEDRVRGGENSHDGGRPSKDEE